MRRLSVNWLAEELAEAPSDFALAFPYSNEHEPLTEEHAARLRAKLAVRYGEWTNRDLRLDLAEDALDPTTPEGRTDRA